MNKPLTKLKTLYEFQTLRELAVAFGIPDKTARNLDSTNPAGRHALAIIGRLIERSEKLTSDQRLELKAKIRPGLDGLYINVLLDFLVEVSRADFGDSRESAEGQNTVLPEAKPTAR